MAAGEAGTGLQVLDGAGTAAEAGTGLLEDAITAAGEVGAGKV